MNGRNRTWLIVMAALLLCAVWPRRLAVRLAVALGVLALVPVVSRPPGVVAKRYA